MTRRGNPIIMSWFAVPGKSRYCIVRFYDADGKKIVKTVRVRCSTRCESPTSSDRQVLDVDLINRMIRIRRDLGDPPFVVCVYREQEFHRHGIGYVLDTENPERIPETFPVDIPEGCIVRRMGRRSTDLAVPAGTPLFSTRDAAVYWAHNGKEGPVKITKHYSTTYPLIHLQSLVELTRRWPSQIWVCVLENWEATTQRFPLGEGEHLEVLCYKSGKVYCLRLGPGDSMDGNVIARLGPEVPAKDPHRVVKSEFLRAILAEGVFALPPSSVDESINKS